MDVLFYSFWKIYVVSIPQTIGGKLFILQVYPEGMLRVAWSYVSRRQESLKDKLWSLIIILFIIIVDWLALLVSSIFFDIQVTYSFCGLIGSSYM